MLKLRGLGAVRPKTRKTLRTTTQKRATHAGVELEGEKPRNRCIGEICGLGVKDCRQVFFKPYRLIFRVMGRDVVVFIIAAGRRDMQSLLTRRLLGA